MDKIEVNGTYGPAPALHRPMHACSTQSTDDRDRSRHAMPLRTPLRLAGKNEAPVYTYLKEKQGGFLGSDIKCTCMGCGVWNNFGESEPARPVPSSMAPGPVMSIPMGNALAFLRTHTNNHIYFQGTSPSF